MAMSLAEKEMSGRTFFSSYSRRVSGVNAEVDAELPALLRMV
jgi:hypothetical protein